MANLIDILGFNPATGLAQRTGPSTFNLGGLITDVIQRIPLPRNIPRPQLPAPRGPTGPPSTTGRGPFPIPIPVPIPIFVDRNGGECGPGGNPCCRGQHLNKSTDCAGNPPGTKCVSNRRMNSLNPKALRRATRRLKGFERAVKGTRKQLRTLAKI